MKHKSLMFSVQKNLSIRVCLSLLLSLSLSFILTSCKSNPHKAQKLTTELEKSQVVSGGQIAGLKNGEMVVQSKAELSEILRDLQNSVYSLEDKVYGTRKLGSLGLYGELRECQRKTSSRQFGGSGVLVWSEPLDRVTDKEEELKIGLDEKEQLVGISAEYIKERMARFQNYRQILQKRADEFSQKIEECRSSLTQRESDMDLPSKVRVQEVSKSSVDRQELNDFLCSYVQTGASLRQLMMESFSRGWLSLSDFQFEQNLLSATVSDSTQKNKENGILFHGWKLAYDQAPILVGELLSLKKDAKLVAWTFSRKSELKSGDRCLAKGEGLWHP